MFKKRRANLLTNYLQQTGENILDDLNFLKHRRYKKFWHNIRLALYIILAVILFLALNLAAFYPSFKTAYNATLDGRRDLVQASFALKQGQFRLATDLSKQAEDNWQTALIRLKRFKFSPVGWLPVIRPKLNDAERLLEAGLNLSQATSAIVEPGQSYLPLLFNPDTKFSELSSEHKAKILADLYNSQEALQKASFGLEQTLKKLEEVKDKELLEKYNINIIELVENIDYTKRIIDQAVPISKILPIMAGYPQKASYLFVLQNQDELRPTGGFIGTIGLAEIKNGNFLRLDTKDVYHLDMPSIGKLKIDPPEPIKRYLDVDEWYLRDANWSPDWPTSVKNITSFYEKENALLPNPDKLDEFDFVVGITSDFIIDLMEFTGPIRIGSQVYTQQNFVDLLQDSTGKDFARLGYSRWDRKAIIGQITKQLQIKLMDSLNDNWVELLNRLIVNLDQKNILVYSRYPDINELFSQREWMGEVVSTNYDYLMVVDSNMAALKTDAVMNKSYNYDLKQTDDGLIASVLLNYANSGQFSWKTTRYRTYTRVYVPQGSTLIKAAGFMNDKVETGEELGKTYFGAFISIEPGAMASLYLEYKLPERINELVQLGKYELLIQKQPGSRVNNLGVDLSFKNPIQLYNPAIFYSYLMSDRRVKWDTDLISDKRFVINL
ncbi:MAG: DUF4012 domain-containing protein [bacterium]